MATVARQRLAIIALCIIMIALLYSCAQPAYTQPLPQCTPVVVTLHSYTRGEIHTDGCLVTASYTRDGLTVDAVSADNLSGDGIFRDGFEVLQ